MKKLPTTLTFLSLGMSLGLVSCGQAVESEPVAGEPSHDVTRMAAEALLVPCQWDSVSGLMTVTVSDGETVTIGKRVVDSALVVNGEHCEGGTAPVSRVKKVLVQDDPSDFGYGSQTVVLDFANGVFAVATATSGLRNDQTGIDVALGEGSGVNSLTVIGSSGNDTVVYKASGIYLNTDSLADIIFDDPDTEGTVETSSAIDANLVYLGSGNDTFSTQNYPLKAGSATPGISVFGEAGNDTFNQPADSLVPETISGGPGTDTLTYAARSLGVTVTMGDGVANDGGTIVDEWGQSTSEGDNILDDIETLVGTNANDVLSGAKSTVALTIRGSAGNDLLIGGPLGDTVFGAEGDDTILGGAGVNALNGEAGDDWFRDVSDEELGPGRDTYNGGVGIDTVDYSARSEDLIINLNGSGDDGAAGEGDNVKADVENAIGGFGHDRITGSGVSNVLAGGPGPDRVDGGLGNDTLDEGGCLNGNDTLLGGGGVDWVDYSGRHTPLAVVMTPSPTGNNGSVYVYPESGAAVCGNGVVEYGESCEDDNPVPTGADGCSEYCQIEPFASCYQVGQACVLDQNMAPASCGNSVVEFDGTTAEECDDGNAVGGDGCSAACKWEGTQVYYVSTGPDPGVLGGSASVSEQDSIAADVENLAGGYGSDTLTGNAVANEILGYGGDDTINGGDGDDLIEGGEGTNTINCGDGDGDIFFSAHLGTDTATECEF